MCEEGGGVGEAMPELGAEPGHEGVEDPVDAAAPWQGFLGSVGARLLGAVGSHLAAPGGAGLQDGGQHAARLLLGEPVGTLQQPVAAKPFIFVN